MDPLPSLLSALKAVDAGTVDQEYNVVRSQTLLLKKEHGLTTEAGSLKENVKKNRYKDILPYDQTRVVLSLQAPGSDYINASFIQGASGACSYIASQGPLSSTLTDFWRMIWQHSVKVIVMACRETEMGKRKCECYWAAPHQSAAFGPFTVSTQVELRPNEEIVVRTLTVSYQQETHSVMQFQYLSWPDHDVPYETRGVLDLLERARSSRGADTSPVLIHCSAGCGRTGVICALDYIHDLLVTKRLTEDFSILKIVLELRRQRPSAVQTRDQYQFIFSAVISMFERFLQTSGDELYCNLPEVNPAGRRLSVAPERERQEEVLSKLCRKGKSRDELPAMISIFCSVSSGHSLWTFWLTSSVSHVNPSPQAAGEAPRIIPPPPCLAVQLSLVSSGEKTGEENLASSTSAVHRQRHQLDRIISRLVLVLSILTRSSLSVDRSSKKATMNDTYAVVNKPKQPTRTTSEPAYSSVAIPRSNPGSRTLPPPHHYDNDMGGASAAPIYSTVKPRVKPQTLPLAASAIYDIATPTSRSREGSDYHLASAEPPSAVDDDYEDVSSTVSDVSSFFSPGGIGFNCRVQKPKGPRDPPAEWGRLER
ncbi:tyrosine-protein phosphatase non-receptor type 18 [Fundulus diaphanus]